MALTEIVGPDLPTSDGTGPTERVPEPAIAEPSEDFTPQPPEGEQDDEKFTVGAPETQPKEDEPPEPGAEPKPSRKARRTQRYDELQQRASAAETAAQEAVARAARAEGMLQAYQQISQQQQAPQPESKDPEEEAYEQATSIAMQMDNLNRAMQARAAANEGKLDPAYEAEYTKKYNKLQFEYHRTIAKAVQPQPQAPPADQVRTETIRAQIESQFPDIVHNPNAGQYAHGEFQRLVALGHPNSMQTLQWAWNAARAQFAPRQPGNGRQQPSPPSPPSVQPPQYVPQMPPTAYPQPPPGPQAPTPYYPAPPPSYMPHGAGGRMVGAPPGSGGADASGPVEVRMTPDMKKMADHAFSHIQDKRQRYQYYVNAVVKPHLIRMRQAGGGQ